MPKDRYIIAQIGTFDCKNFGDLLFPNVLEWHLKKRGQNAELVLFSPMGGEKPFESGTLVYPICDLERLYRERHFDAIVIGGGDLIRLDSGWASQEKYDVDASTMELWLIPAVVSLKYDIPLLWNSPGVPFPFTAAQTPLVKLALDAADYLSVRDETSRDNLGETEACRVAVSPDTVFTVDGLYPREKTDGLFLRLCERFGFADDFMVFQVNQSVASPDACAAALQEVQTKYGSEIVFMPIGYVHMDKECMRMLYSAVSGRDLKIRFIEDELSPVEMIAMLSHARCFIGTSLHGSAVSSAYGVPAVALNFANLAKVRGAFRLLGAEDCLAADFADLPAAMDAALKRSASAAAELRRQAEEHMDRLIGCIGAPKRHAFTQRGAQSFFLEVHHMLTKGVTQRRGILYYARPSSDFSESARQDFTWHQGKPFVREFVFDAPVVAVRLDPLEGSGCIVWNLHILADGCAVPEDYVVVPCGAKKQGTYFLLDSDPQLVIRMPRSARTIRVEAHMCSLDESQERLWAQTLDNKLQFEETPDASGSETMQRILCEKEAHIAELTGALEEARRHEIEMRAAHEAIVHSTFWRMTWPLRRLVGMVKGKR